MSWSLGGLVDSELQILTLVLTMLSLLMSSRKRVPKN